jgi:hypothetical protein
MTATPARWPALLNAKDAAAYLSFTRTQFNALVRGGLIPPGHELIVGHPRWSKDELDACITQLHAIKLQDGRIEEQRRAAAALDAFTPKIRRGNVQRREGERRA